MAKETQEYIHTYDREKTHSRAGPPLGNSMRRVRTAARLETETGQIGEPLTGQEISPGKCQVRGA